jgi:hypothetical protein
MGPGRALADAAAGLPDRDVVFLGEKQRVAALDRWQSGCGVGTAAGLSASSAAARRPPRA